MRLIHRSASCFALLLASVSWIPAHAQSYNKQDIYNYIDQWWTTAVVEMEEFGIPASISLAQGILESAAGQSRLAMDGNNHFGIKCHRGWDGKRIFHDDDRKGECFRKYRSAADSWTDHSDFLASRDRYSTLFALRRTDYRGWAKGLKKAGYATNPKYADLLINLIEQYELDQYDRMGKEEILASRSERIKSTETEAPETRDVISTEIFYFNRIKTVSARKGDSPESVAARYDIRLSWISRYNDVSPGDEFAAGSKVFLQPKRRKGQAKYHTVREGESMRDISQINGVDLDLLHSRNLVVPGFQPEAGEQINLRKKRKSPPRARKATPGSGESHKPRAQIKPATSQRLASPASSSASLAEERSSTTDKTSRSEETQSQKPRSVASRQSETTASTREARETQKTTEAPSQPAAVPKAMHHTVAPGETLYSLSRSYKTSVERIRAWNRLQDNTIRIGQQLIVGWE